MNHEEWRWRPSPTVNKIYSLFRVLQPLFLLCFTYYHCQLVNREAGICDWLFIVIRHHRGRICQSVSWLSLGVTLQTAYCRQRRQIIMNLLVANRKTASSAGVLSLAACYSSLQLEPLLADSSGRWAVLMLQDSQENSQGLGTF